jgi:hypothetical protein
MVLADEFDGRLRVAVHILVVRKIFIMDDQHTQSAVGPAYAFLEDMFGVERERQAPEDPGLFTYQTVGEVSLEMRRRDETDEERRAFWAF